MLRPLILFHFILCLNDNFCEVLFLLLNSAHSYPLYDLVAILADTSRDHSLLSLCLFYRDALSNSFSDLLDAESDLRPLSLLFDCNNCLRALCLRRVSLVLAWLLHIYRKWALLCHLRDSCRFLARWGFFNCDCAIGRLGLHSDFGELLVLSVVQEGDRFALAEFVQALSQLFDFLPQLRSLRGVEQLAFLVVLD